jgi:hypothetical protein
MMKIINIIIFIPLILGSCATLFNSPSENLTIITNEPCKVVVNHDSLKSTDNEHEVTINRSRKSLFISAYNDNKQKDIIVPSCMSFAYWLNVYSTAWIGFIIDLNTPKRYAYPSTIYLDMKSNKNNYLTIRPLDSILSKCNNIVKITPLKTIGFTNAGLEISYERKFSNIFSTQFMASWLFPNSTFDSPDYINPNTKGFRGGIEEKYYFKKSAPKGPYISLELNYMNNQYKVLDYFHAKDVNNDPPHDYITYPDTFGIKKQTMSINFKVGYQFIIDHLCIDIYAGLGPRYKNVEHFDRIKPEDVLEVPRHPNIYYITNYPGKYWTLSIPLNVRIGWIF